MAFCVKHNSVIADIYCLQCGQSYYCKECSFFHGNHKSMPVDQYQALTNLRTTIRQHQKAIEFLIETQSSLSEFIETKAKAYNKIITKCEEDLNVIFSICRHSKEINEGIIDIKENKLLQASQNKALKFIEEICELIAGSRDHIHPKPIVLGLPPMPKVSHSKTPKGEISLQKLSSPSSTTISKPFHTESKKDIAEINKTFLTNMPSTTSIKLRKRSLNSPFSSPKIVYSENNCHSTFASCEEYVHLFNSGTKELFKYIISMKKTMKCILPNIAPYYSDSVKMGRYIFLMGGSSNKFSGPYSNIFWRFRSENTELSFVEKAPLLKGKQTLSPCFPSALDCLYIVGGYNGEFLPQVEKYSLTENCWKSLPPLNFPRCAIATCIFNDKYLFAFGGYSSPNAFERLNILLENKFEICQFKDVKESIQYMRAIQLTGTEMLVFGEGISKIVCEDDGILAVKSIGQLKSDNYFWCYSNCFLLSGKVYGIDKMGDIHIYSIDCNTWDIVHAKEWMKND